MRHKITILSVVTLLTTLGTALAAAPKEDEKVEVELVQLTERVKQQEAAGDPQSAAASASVTIRHYGKAHAKTKDALWVMAGIYERAELWPQYLAVIKRLHTVAKSLYGQDKNSIDLARYAYILGQAYARVADYADAAREYQQAVAMVENSDDFRSEYKYLSALAEAFEELEKWEDAEKTLQRAATVAEKFGDYTFGYALDAINRLYEKIYAKSGRVHPEAEALNKRRIEAWANLEDRVVSVGAAYEDLGDVYLATNRYADAEAAYRQAVAISKKRYGEKNKVATSPVSGLAQALAMQKRLDEAGKLFMETIAIWKKESIAPWAHIIARWRSYIDILAAAGENDKAENFQRRVDALTERHGAPTGKR